MSGRERAYDLSPSYKTVKPTPYPSSHWKIPKLWPSSNILSNIQLQMKLLALSNVPSHFSRPMRPNGSLHRRLWPLLLTSHRCQPPHTTSKSRVEPTQLCIVFCSSFNQPFLENSNQLLINLLRINQRHLAQPSRHHTLHAWTVPHVRFHHRKPWIHFFFSKTENPDTTE